ncbi:MAG: PilT/PilU family type 4a pilus ATPase, partial [Hungatella sp.]
SMQLFLDNENHDDDFSFALPKVARFRANIFRQRGSLAGVIRVVNFQLPDYHELHIPQSIINVAQLNRGFVLVTGPAGSGKSTTLACIIDEINRTKNKHVVTLEDPIEYLHRHKKSIVTQREITTDTENYVSGLRAALREAPDVILLGEMRDYETIRTAMTAAETGHLLITTLHTVGAANTIDRIIDNFPPEQQHQIRVQLSMVLQTVISQQLVPTVDGTICPVFEIMFLNSAIRNMIRESKIHQIDGVIATSKGEGMLSMDASLLKLYKEGTITRDTAISYSVNAEQMEKRTAN